MCEISIIINTMFVESYSGFFSQDFVYSNIYTVYKKRKNTIHME